MEVKAPPSALSFVGWAAFGALVVLAVISLPFLWIAALLALCLLAFSGSTRPAPFGLALGAGLVSLTVAFINRNSEQQPVHRDRTAAASTRGPG